MTSQGSIGARLKREREKKSFSVEDVHLRLRIHPSVISRLESDSLQDWPGGKIYARGFLRQYAEFLGMNVAEILSEFDSLGIAERPVELFVGLEREAEGGSAEPHKPRRPRAEKKRETPSTQPAARSPKPPQPDLVEGLPPVTSSSGLSNQSPRLAAKLVIAVMVLVVVVLAVLQISRSVRRWSEERSSMKMAAMTGGSMQKSSRSSAPEPAAGASHIQDTAKSDGQFLNSPSQGTYPKIRPQDRMMLEINAIADVWMRIKADGGVVYESILKRGDTERWLADKLFEVKFGRPEGVRVSMNGYPLGQPGAGKIKNLRFSRAGIEEIRS